MLVFRDAAMAALDAQSLGCHLEAFWRRQAATWRVSPCWSSDDHFDTFSFIYMIYLNYFGSIILQGRHCTQTSNIFICFISGTCLHFIHVTVLVEVLEKFICWGMTCVRHRKVHQNGKICWHPTRCEDWAVAYLHDFWWKGWGWWRYTINYQVIITNK